MTVGEKSGGSVTIGTAQLSVQEKSESPRQRHVSRMGSKFEGNFLRGNSLSRRTAGRLKAIAEAVKQDVTVDLIRSGYMDLGKVADGLSQAYLTFKLNQTTAKDLSMLKNCRHLQRLELSKNELCELSHLSGMENLVYLNVSDNMLTDLLDIPEPAPHNLRGADFRSNRITDFSNTAEQLKSFSNLSNLALDRNCIQSAMGLSALSHLLNLSITNNKLRGCEGLDALTSLVHLDLSFNCITSIQPLRSLSRLHVLLVSDNHLTSLNGISGCKSLNRLDVHENRITVLSDVADAAQCPLLGTLNLSRNPAQQCMDYRLHIVFLLPQVSNLDSLLVDEKEKVHAQNLHGADAEGLKATRDHYFPHGELDDGGGAIPPIAAGLLPDDGRGIISGGSGPEDFARIDALVDELPLSCVAEGVLAFGDFLQEHMTTQLELSRAVFRWLVRNITFPEEDNWGQSVTAPLLPGHEEIEEKLCMNSSGTWSERVALLFVALAKACHLEAVTVSGFWRHEGLQPGSSLIAHNHCWNAIKVDGLWRLLDCADGARLHGHTYGFFTAPEHFQKTYQPLNAPWSLRRDYISDHAFFSQMWVSVKFFKAGCRLLDPVQGPSTVHLPAPMEGLPLPVQWMRLAIAPGYRVTQRLISASGEQLYPFQKKPWEQPDPHWQSRPGNPIFQDMGAGPDAIESVETPGGDLPCRVHRLAVALPKPGEYVHEIIVMKELPGAISCMLPDKSTLGLNLEDRFLAIRVKYVLPEAIAHTDMHCPAASTDIPQSSLPHSSPLCASLGAQIVEPPLDLQLEADREQQFTLRAPGMSEMMLIPRLSLSQEASRLAKNSSCSTLSSAADCQPAISTQAIELPWEEDKEAFSLCLVVPRVVALDVVARSDATAPWKLLFQMQVLPESQHLTERPDLVFQPPIPDPKDPRMLQVRDIMKNVDQDGDGLISKKEYLVKIRKDRKYADFLKMPPRICQADGTLEQFLDIFHAINCSRTGKFTQNELAYYLGCNPQRELTSERSIPASVDIASVVESSR